FGGWELALPGYLVWIALGYAGVGAAVATWLGQPLTRVANLRHVKEADFRFGLASARESGATIALQSIDSARPKVERQFDGLIESWTRQTRALAHLIMFSSSWTVLSQAAPILVAAPRYIAGTITLGVLMQIAQAFQQMTQALAWPIDNMQRLAEARASFTRVTQLYGWLVESQPESQPEAVNRPSAEVERIEIVDRIDRVERIESEVGGIEIDDEEIGADVPALERSEVAVIATAIPASVVSLRQRPVRLH
ncbi:MAG: SbmA/BacA-like family transporter, partial [Lautropia sp.]